MKILDLTNDEFMALGRVVAIGSYLEHYIHICIWSFIGIKDLEEGIEKTGGFAFREVLKVMEFLWRDNLKKRDNGASLITELNGISDNLVKAMDRRHDVVHGVWASEEYENQDESEQDKPLLARGIAKRFGIRLRRKKESAHFSMFEYYDTDKFRSVEKQIALALMELMKFSDQHFPAKQS